MRWIIPAMLFVVSTVSVPRSAAAEPSAEALEKWGAKFTRTKGAITQLQVNADSFSEVDFRTLAGCGELRRLTISGKTINDANLPLLADLVQLEELSTDRSMLSDDGYKHFAAFKNLKKLSLFHPSWALKEFTGRGLAHLKSLPKLERLTFAGSTADDAALEGVGQISQLKEFSTWHTRQTQAGNLHLTKLPNLVFLKMGQRLPAYGSKSPPSFDDSTLAVFAKIPTLERLELFEARLTAKGLEPLTGLPNLKQLSIHTTDIRPADIDVIRAAMPKVKVDWRPLTPEENDATLIKKLRI